MKNIQEDIKTGNFKQAYLLYGEEAYLKQQYKHKLVQALNPEDDTMNFNHYEGRNIDVKELIDLCETMPFFADRRVVLLEDTGFFKNKCDELADYMKELPDYLCLIFVENEVDKRNRMYKAVKAAGLPMCKKEVPFQSADKSYSLLRKFLPSLLRHSLQATAPESL